MWSDFLDRECVPLPSNVAAFGAVADTRHWISAANTLGKAGASLLALWGSDDRDRDQCLRVRAAYLLPDRVVLIETCDARRGRSVPLPHAVLSSR